MKWPMKRWLPIPLAAALCACGSHYEPPDLPTTGAPAGPLGQVFDVDVVFPTMQLFEAQLPGVRFEMRVEMEWVGYGVIPARVSYGQAEVPLGTFDIDDVSTGETTITVTPERWVSGILGPLRLGGSSFELVLDGAPDDEAWHVGGRATASQGLTPGSFEGWRRHRFLVAATDYFSTVGRVEEVALVRENELRVRRRLELVSSDPVLRVDRGVALAINRFTFDNLQRLDPLSDFATSWQASAGAGANPQDALVLAEDRAYLTRYEPPYNDVAIFDPGNGRILGTIALGPWAANRDGTPRATAMRQAAGAVFVALQDIDRTFTRYEEGKLAVIDPALDQVVDVIPLGGKNPHALEVLRDAAGQRERLYVALAGIFPGLLPGELSGGVVVVDPLHRVVERVALDDDVAGGNIGAVALASERLGYVIVSDERYHNRVLAFDPELGVVRRTVTENAEPIPGIALDTHGVLAIPDRRFHEPRTCLYRVPSDPERGEAFVWCIGNEMPPASIVALD